MRAKSEILPPYFAPICNILSVIIPKGEGIYQNENDSISHCLLPYIGAC